MERPKSINEIWSERDLCKRLDLPIKGSGRSTQLTNWVKGGLRSAEKSGRRYFFEEDVIDYLLKRREVESGSESS